MTAAAQTALVVEVPAADPVVGALRARLDRAASWGVPAHITLVYPFLPPAEIDDEVRAAVGAIVAAVPCFALTLARVGWFGDAVLWPAPDPGGPFTALIEALGRRFPGALPYGGAHEEIVPHLTVGHDQPRAVLDAAAAEVVACLPIRTRVTAVRLITGVPEPAGGGWQALAEFPLAPS